MWRWVTRGLVLTVLATCLPTALYAQDLVAALDFPDPTVPNYGMVLIKGWVLDPVSVARLECQQVVAGLEACQRQHRAMLHNPVRLKQLGRKLASVS